MDYNFDWINAYNSFALKILEFKNDRKKLIDLIREAFKENYLEIPKLQETKELDDIDPFTIMGLFNKPLKESTRVKIFSALAKKLNLEATVTSFSGIPTLNQLNATYYRFGKELGENDIENIWQLFIKALNFSKEPTEENKNIFSHYFDIVVNMKGNGTAKVTMGLYWMDANAFTNMDSRNIWYVYDTDKFLTEDMKDALPKKKEKMSAEDYLKFMDIIKSRLNSGKTQVSNFAELSYDAWQYSEEINIKNKREKENKERDKEGRRYWIYSPGEKASKWEYLYEKGLIAIGWSSLGDLRKIKSKREMVARHREVYNTESSCKNDSSVTWEFVNVMKPGDVVYVKKGRKKLIGKGIVKSEYFYDENTEDDYKHVREIQWTHKGEWDHPGNAVIKTLTDITKYDDYVAKLKILVEENKSIDNKTVTNGNDIEIKIDNTKKCENYTKEQFLSEVYVDDEQYEILCDIVKNNKNVILQGAPGVGKTFMAKKIAYVIMGEKDEDRIKTIQFHQNYSYEDFILGYKPDGDTFALQDGIFYRFCQKALLDSGRDYFFIIDEINRGNLSKIFGEMLMLIEKSHRGEVLELAYGNNKNLVVPQNLHIIGMMNTADRSLAMIDYALRRRFNFYTVKPALENDKFREYINSLENEKIVSLINKIVTLNDEIKNDSSLGEGFMIGHSYFCDLSNNNLDNRLKGIVKFDILPTLKEYWFDNETKYNDWNKTLIDLIK